MCGYYIHNLAQGKQRVSLRARRSDPTAVNRGGVRLKVGRHSFQYLGWTNATFNCGEKQIRRVAFS